MRIGAKEGLFLYWVNGRFACSRGDEVETVFALCVGGGVVVSMSSKLLVGPATITLQITLVLASQLMR